MGTYFYLLSSKEEVIIAVRFETCERGGMADALGSGPSVRMDVEVQLLSLAPNLMSKMDIMIIGNHGIHFHVYNNKIYNKLESVILL